MGKYRRKPSEIEAIQFTGENDEEIREFGASIDRTDICQKILSLYIAANDVWVDLEIGEWIAQDELGFYPIKNQVFEKNYEPIGT